METPQSETVQPGPSEESPSGSSPAAPSEAPAPATPPADAPAEAPAAEAPDPYSAAKSLDPHKLLAAHPDLARLVDAKAGEVGDKLYRRREPELTAQLRAQLEAERHQAYLDSLVDQDDLVGLGEEAKRRVLADRQQRQTLTGQQQVARHAEAILGQAVVEAFASLPPPVQSVLYDADGTTYKRWAPGGTTAQGIAELVRAAYERGVDVGIKERLPQVKAEVRAAVVRELNGDALEGEPSPDTRPGATGGGRVVTDADIGRMTLQEYDALFEENGAPKPGVLYRPGRRRSAA